jgi:MoaA/NifB/PqqE/SkfB family radical SAM enzyme
MKAIDIALKNRLVVAVTLCATKEFVNEANLDSYFRLVKDAGVHFVQILEARAIGQFAGEDVSLSKDQYHLLDRAFSSMNSQIRYRSMPIVNFHGYHQKRMGCFGGGERFMYIDPYGDIYPCPFSDLKIGNAMMDESAINTQSCHCDETCERYNLWSHMHKAVFPAER